MESKQGVSWMALLCFLLLSQIPDFCHACWDFWCYLHFSSNGLCMLHTGAYFLELCALPSESCEEGLEHKEMVKTESYSPEWLLSTDTESSKCCWACGKIRNRLHCCWKYKVAQLMWEWWVWWFPKKLKIELLYDSTILFLSMHPKAFKGGPRGYLCIRVYSSTAHNGHSVEAARIFMEWRREK